MSHIELSSPSRREREEVPHLHPFDTTDVMNLGVPEKAPAGTFAAVLSGRRSRRGGEAPSIDDMSSLLWHCAKTKEVAIEDSGFQWEHRSAPSGGGRHPIDLLVANLRGAKEGLHHYDSLTHSLSLLGDTDCRLLQNFMEAVDGVLPINNGCVLWFAAQFEKTLSKYQDGDSLVWIDAGCLMATVYMVAESLGLNCCAIGITGEPHVSRMLTAAPLVEGVAGCLIWKKVSGNSVTLS